MAFTWEGEAYASGYTTGGTSGIQISQPLTFVVSGLKYDDTGLDYTFVQYLTGIARTASGHGSFTDVTGHVYWNNDQWEAQIIITNTDEIGRHTTGYINWYYNSGVAEETGIELETGYIDIFANASARSWELISSTLGGILNADLEHTHEGLVSPGYTGLSDLDDVAEDAGLSYTDGKVLRADGDSYEESYLYIADIPNLATWSGDYLGISGSVWDYPVLSGDYSDLSIDYTITSGALVSLLADYTTTSGDYVYTSGDYAELSGYYVTHIADFYTFSGDYVILSGDFAAYGDISGDYAEASGDWEDRFVNDPWSDIWKEDTTHTAHRGGIWEAFTERIDDINHFGASWEFDTGHTSSKQKLYHAIVNLTGISGTYEVGVNTGGYAEVYSTKILTGLIFRTLTGSQYIQVTEYDAHIGIDLAGEPGVTTHSGLSGLAEDDHTQYLLRTDTSGYEAISGDYLTTSGTVDDYKVVSGVAATALQNPIIATLTLTGDLLQLGDQTISGDIYCSGSVWGSVYNDYADAWPIASGIDKIPGAAYSLNNSGLLVLSNKRNDKKYFGIYSDTFGHVLGLHRNDETKIPLSVAGFVKAHVVETYPAGTYLTTHESGRLIKARFWEKKVAQYIRKDENERSWVKIL